MEECCSREGTALLLIHCASSSPHLLRTCRAVCRAWRDAVDQASEAVFVEPLRELCRMLSNLSQNGLWKKKTRVEFLDATLALIQGWNAPVLGHIKLWRLLCAELRKSLKETWTFMVGQNEINETFDIFELALRRYWQNIQSLVCVHNNTHACESIADKEAQEVWKGRFGEKCSFVPWKVFSELLDPSPEIRKAVKFLINFPDDGIISVYKFDLLSCLFGPSYSAVQNNIKLYACGPGFAGIINRIRAKQLLTDHWKRYNQSWFLIRLSRTEPDFLVFSTIDREGKVVHSLFKKNTLGTKIASLKKLYAVLPVKLMDEAFKNESLSSYASAHGYCVMFSEGEEEEEEEKKRKEKELYMYHGLAEEQPTVAPSPAPATNKLSASYSMFAEK